MGENLGPVLTNIIMTEFENVVVSLANRFHVAVRLFSNRSQLASNCGKNKKVANKAIALIKQL